MKNKLKLIVTTLSLGALSALNAFGYKSDDMSPHSEEMHGGNWYVHAFGNVGGAHKTKIKQDSQKVADVDWEISGGGGAAFGYYMDDKFRLELELAFRHFSADKVKNAAGTSLGGSGYDVNVFSGMVNGYYDHHLNADFDLYLGLGLGIANVDHKKINDITTKDYDKVRFAYQAMVGVTYHINDQWAANAGYRFFGANSVKEGGFNFDDLHSHNFDFGIRYSW